MVTLLILSIIAIALWVLLDITARRSGTDPTATVHQFNRALGALERPQRPRRLHARGGRRP
jgi:hypothetical protein